MIGWCSKRKFSFFHVESLLPELFRRVAKGEGGNSEDADLPEASSGRFCGIHPGERVGGRQQPELRDERMDGREGRRSHGESTQTLNFPLQGDPELNRALPTHLVAVSEPFIIESVFGRTCFGAQSPFY